MLGRLNIGLRLFLSAGKRANNAGLSGVMLDISVEFGMWNLRSFATPAIVALVVLKGCL